MHRSLALTLLAALLLGCLSKSGASAHAIPQVRVYAESDLDCPQDEIRVVEHMGGRFLALGCGRRAEYMAACEGLRCVVEPQGKTIPFRARPDPM